MTDRNDDDARASADAILVDAERLKSLEARKQALDPADPEFASLSVEADELATEVKHKTRAEVEISRDAVD